jgi:hypothetical protein
MILIESTIHKNILKIIQIQCSQVPAENSESHLHYLSTNSVVLINENLQLKSSNVIKLLCQCKRLPERPSLHPIFYANWIKILVDSERHLKLFFVFNTKRLNLILTRF